MSDVAKALEAARQAIADVRERPLAGFEHARLKRQHATALAELERQLTEARAEIEHLRHQLRIEADRAWALVP